MKRVLISQVDSPLGGQLVRLFERTTDYEVFGTVRANELEYLCGAMTPPVGVTKVVPSYRTERKAFKVALLSADVIVSLLNDDTMETEAAAKMLCHAHFEVEKTFVVVSSVLSWANTLVARKAQQLADKRAEIAQRKADGEEIDPEEEEEMLKDGDEEGEEPPTVEESEYSSRVSHPRYQHLKELEVFVKKANSETLHTHVIFAGMTYGAGEQALREAFHNAALQMPVPMYTDGRNVVPMIHITDLANIVFKTASSSDVIDNRYLLAVDKGNHTLGSVLSKIAGGMGCGMTAPLPLESCGPALPLESDLLGLDVRMDGSAVMDVHPEDEWVAPNGFLEAFDRVATEFRAASGLFPVRCAIAGPPLAGKSAVATEVSCHYRIPHLTVPSMLSDYRAHLSYLQTKLRRHRASRREQLRLEEREANKAQAAAAGEEEAEDGDEEDEERPVTDEAEHPDDVSDIVYDNDGAHLEEMANDGDEEGEEAEEGGEGAAPEAEAAEDEDDPDDEIAAEINERISYAKQVLSLRVREGVLANEEEDLEDIPVEERPLPPGARWRYADEALAAVARWRLQQADCRNQGFILDGFPKTVNQARLVFRINDDEPSDIPLPSAEEVQSREADEEVEPEEALAQVDPRLLPDTLLHLACENALVMGRSCESDPHRCTARLLTRLNKYRAAHSPSAVPSKSLLGWFKAITAAPQGPDGKPATDADESGPAPRPRQVVIAELDAGLMLSDEGNRRALTHVRSMVGPRGFPSPTVEELLAAAVRASHDEDAAAFKARRADEKRAEDEAREREERERQVAVHQRRYRSIAEEKAKAAELSAMPMEAYLARFALPAITAGVKQVITIRPDDPLNSLADFLFAYNPRKQL